MGMMHKWIGRKGEREKEANTKKKTSGGTRCLFYFVFFSDLFFPKVAAAALQGFSHKGGVV